MKIGLSVIIKWFDPKCSPKLAHVSPIEFKTHYGVSITLLPSKIKTVKSQNRYLDVHYDPKDIRNTFIKPICTKNDNKIPKT